MPTGVIRSGRYRRCQADACAPAVYTAADLSAYGPLKWFATEESLTDRQSVTRRGRHSQATGSFRLGDPVACVIAETVAQAKDAAEAATIDVEPLPQTQAADAVT